MNIPHTTSLILRDIAHKTASLTLAVALAYAIPAHAQSNDELDPALQQAKAFEATADYQNALNSYREYLQLGTNKSAERRQARLKLPVLQEAVNHGSGPELPLYLNAMDLRALGEIDAAESQLQEIIDSYPGSSLSDDAWYLLAYMALMDRYDYEGTNELLQTLRYNHPDSHYVDTTLFIEAITLEQMGDSDGAIAKMTELRDRHTGVSVAGMSWARDEYVSRLWFERSDKRIEYLQERAASATKLISMTPYGIDGYQWQAELSVAHQQMTLLLNESTSISNITVEGSQSQATEKVNAYSGIVMGQPESWARISIDNPSVRGMISVYGERHKLIPIASGGSLSDFHTLLLADADGNISDEQDHVLTPPKSEDNLNNYLRSIRAASDVQLTPGTVSQVAMIGVVIDSKYNDYYNGRGAEEALAILNTTDGLFREQLGIALQVDSVQVFSDQDNDPMNLGSVTMEAMMRNFKDYRLDSDSLGSEIGLATLFSGNKNTDSALGLAWIGSACRTDGFDVSVVSPYKDPSLLSTHEIGHTLGAPHDTDTSCSNENYHMMWPFLSSNSGRTFSSCSTQSMTETMQGNNCHVDAIDLSIDLDEINSDSLSLSITNQDSQRAIPAADITLLGPGVGDATSSASCVRINSDQLNCSISSLTPMQYSSLNFDFPTPLSASAEIIAIVSGSGFIDVITQNNSFKTDINGRLMQYSGSISNDSLRVAGGSTSTSGTSSNSGSTNNTTPSTEAGGIVHPASLLMLAMLIAARRRTFQI